MKDFTDKTSIGRTNGKRRNRHETGEGLDSFEGTKEEGHGWEHLCNVIIRGNTELRLVCQLSHQRYLCKKLKMTNWQLPYPFALAMNRLTLQKELNLQIFEARDDHELN